MAGAMSIPVSTLWKMEFRLYHFLCLFNFICCLPTPVSTPRIWSIQLPSTVRLYETAFRPQCVPPSTRSAEHCFRSSHWWVESVVQCSLARIILPIPTVGLTVHFKAFHSYCFEDRVPLTSRDEWLYGFHMLMATISLSCILCNPTISHQ